MAKRKIPFVSNPLTPQEQAFIEGGIADSTESRKASSVAETEKTEDWIALNMLVPKRIKNEMKAYKEYGGFKRIGDLQEKVWEFFKENHRSSFQDIKNSWNIDS